MIRAHTDDSPKAAISSLIHSTVIRVGEDELDLTSWRRRVAPNYSPHLLKYRLDVATKVWELTVRVGDGTEEKNCRREGVS